jgi:hypothetical protein
VGGVQQRGVEGEIGVDLALEIASEDAHGGKGRLLRSARSLSVGRSAAGRATVGSTVRRTSPSSSRKASLTRWAKRQRKTTASESAHSVRGTDEGAAPWACADQALGGQDAERLTDDGAAHAEPLLQAEANRKLGYRLPLVVVTAGSPERLQDSGDEVGELLWCADRYAQALGLGSYGSGLLPRH